MELGSISEQWYDRFGSVLPDWACRMQQQDVDGEVAKCKKRIADLQTRLDQEQFLLGWLDSIRRSGLDSEAVEQETQPSTSIVKETAGFTLSNATGEKTKTPNTRADSPEAPSQASASSLSLRRRALEQVDRQDARLAKIVTRKLVESGKHNSLGGIDSVLSAQTSENLDSGQKKHRGLARLRSQSDSNIRRERAVVKLSTGFQVDAQDTLSPIPDTDNNQESVSLPPNGVQKPMDGEDLSVEGKLVMAKAKPGSHILHEEKRLSNGNSSGMRHDSSDSDCSDPSSEVKQLAIVMSMPAEHSQEDLLIEGGFPRDDTCWMETSGTLKGDMALPLDQGDDDDDADKDSEEGVGSHAGEATPTELRRYNFDSLSSLEKGITSDKAYQARTTALGEGVIFPLSGEEARMFTSSDDPADDRDSDNETEGEYQLESTSLTDLEATTSHTFFNLPESTLTYILQDTLFSSRSNSISSLARYDRSTSPEGNTPSTPLDGVSRRPNSTKRKDRNRVGHFLENHYNSGDQLADEERLAQMLADLRDASPVRSRSPSSPTSDLSYSNPASPTHTGFTLDEPEPVMRPSSMRASRMYQMRRSVVVHGEVLVIRKLVVAGIVSAEKTYLDSLLVMREYYRKPLLALCTTTQPILPERDVNTIFYRIEDLITLHTDLHSKIEAQLQNWSMESEVGDFFLELCKNLKLYKDYVEMYRRSLECLERCKHDPIFRKFLEDVRLTVSGQGQFKDIPNVNELLRRPVERLQSYSLVLNDLCQHTPDEHPDYSVLKQSFTVMSDFIASTHDPKAFSQLSGGFNRELVKQELVVELLDGGRKIRRLFLFHDILICAKEKSARHTQGVKLEPKWCLPLHDLRFHPIDGSEARQPVPVTSDQEMSVIKSRIAELKAMLNKDSKEKTGKATGKTMDKDGSFKRGIKAHIISSKQEKLRKKLQEQQVSYWIASPSLPLRIYSTSGKKRIFLVHNEDERESWIAAIKKLQPKAVQTPVLSQVELQDLLSRQKVHLTRDQQEVIEVQTDEDEYLTGILRVRVLAATDLKAKLAGLHCAIELDEYGRFDRKARTLPSNTDPTTLTTTWDQDFELEAVGTHMMRVLVFSKYLLKEEVHASGKIRIPIKQLKSNKRQKAEVKLHPRGTVTVTMEYFSSLSSIGKRPALMSSGVFGFPMDVVAKRERHPIPLIVQTCVDEVEKRGLSEVGVYRVAGVLRDVQELRASFDTDYLQAQLLAADLDIHAVAGLLKRYFRELPDPLFTDELYLSFVQALGLSDPEAREQSLITLFHSLPPVNFKTAVFLFRHLRTVAEHKEENKMTLNNLSTVFGPNLLRPGYSGSDNFMAAAMDVISPVNVLLFFLTCPEEVYEEPPSMSAISVGTTSSTSSSGNKASSRKRSGLVSIDDDFLLGGYSSPVSTPSHQTVPPSPISTTSSGSGPVRYKQSVI